MRQEFLSQMDQERVPVVAAQRWFAPGRFSMEHVQDSENFVYRLYSTGSEDSVQARPAFYLRLTHEGHRTHGQIEAEMAFIQFLAALCRVSCPVPSRSGNLVERISPDTGKPGFHACLLEAAPGTQVAVGSSDWRPMVFEAWGQAMARLHERSLAFTPQGPNRRWRWDEDDVLVNAEQYLPASEQTARQELQRVLAWAATQPVGKDQFGLIHGDLCRPNFHWDGQQITVFDFDDSCYHWFLYDVVCAVAPALFRPVEERQVLRASLVRGYERIRPLPSGWEETFIWLLRLRGLYLYILFNRDWKGDRGENPRRAFLDRMGPTFDQPLSW